MAPEDRGPPGLRDLRGLRDSLDLIDRRILQALAEREAVVAQVGSLKSGEERGVRDVEREEALLGRLADLAAEQGLSPDYVTRLYRDILDHSVRRQQQDLQGGLPSRPETLRVAVRGGPGSEGREAASRHFASHAAGVELCGYGTLEELVEAVAAGAAHRGMLPLERTTAGSLNASYDLLARFELAIVGEELLAGPAGVLGRELTRYAVLSREPLAWDARIPCKTSLMLATRHVEGALLRCLSVLARHHLNLTKLESRPRTRIPWEYLFYLDFEGNVADPAIQAALQDLKAEASFLKLFGSYPARTVADARPASPRPVVPRPGSVDPASPPAGSAPLDPEILRTLEKKAYKLASRVARSEDTVVRVGGVLVGAGAPVIIAGPCSVESREQVMACAREVKALGGHILRGGCFKPRTSPYAFQGLGLEGLDLLAEAGRRFGLPIVTEVLRPADVEPVARKADMLQIGARNMQNFALLKEVGRIDRPVMLKRGMMASIDEWLAAAEYILDKGNQQVVLCERGIRTFETATRNTLDLSAVPVVRERTHLPVLVDPSHACGTRRWVPPLVEAALASGAHGVMVEIHPRPEEALSDGPQALTFELWRELMGRIAGRLGS